MKAKKNILSWKKTLAKEGVLLNSTDYKPNLLIWECGGPEYIWKQKPCTTLLGTPMYVIADGNQHFRELRVMKTEIELYGFEFKILHPISKNKKKIRETKE